MQAEASLENIPLDETSLQELQNINLVEQELVQIGVFCGYATPAELQSHIVKEIREFKVDMAEFLFWSIFVLIVFIISATISALIYSKDFGMVSVCNSIVVIASIVYVLISTINQRVEFCGAIFRFEWMRKMIIVWFAVGFCFTLGPIPITAASLTTITMLSMYVMNWINPEFGYVFEKQLIDSKSGAMRRLTWSRSSNVHFRPERNDSSELQEVVVITDDDYHKDNTWAYGRAIEISSDATVSEGTSRIEAA
jgi:hypothetical protein